MTLAQGARSQLLHKVQSAFGTLASGNYTKFRFSRHSLKSDKGTVESEMIRADREVSDYRHTTRSASGDVEFELCDGDHENIISSAMFGTWGTDTIKIGTTPQYITFEDGALDIARYQLFKDMLVSRMRFQFVPAEIVKVTASLVGTAMSLAGSTGGGTAVNASSNQPFDALNGALYDNRAETGTELAVVSAMTLEIDNGARPVFAVGSPDAVNIEYGRGRVSGELTCFYEDATWPTRFLNETEASLVLNLTDPTGNALEFRMDRIKCNGADAAVQNEQSRMLRVPFVALLPTIGANPSALVISRA